MTISKKWVATAASALLFATFLTGCSEEKAPTGSADQAVKDAYTKLWSESYNYAGEAVLNVNFDENALIGTQGGLTPEEAEQELELLDELQSGDARQALEMMKNGKVTMKGAFDSKNMKFDSVFGVHYEMGGMKAAVEIPMLLDFKNEVALYIDPKAAAAFGGLPPQFNNKLIKITLNDIPGITAAQKAKLQDGSVYKKFEEISNSYIKNIDASHFSEITVTDAAKQAGATRLVQLTLTPQEQAKMSQDMVFQLLDTFGPEFDLDADMIKEAKENYRESNKNMELFTGNTVTEYGLDKNGQIVYLSSTQSFKGAKHVGQFNVVMSLKDFGKPVFTIDPSKQQSVSVSELMM